MVRWVTFSRTVHVRACWQYRAWDAGVGAFSKASAPMFPVRSHVELKFIMALVRTA